MSLIRDLAEQMIEEHPERAAAVLERLEPEETVRLLARGDPRSAGSLLRRLAPHTTQRVLSQIEPGRATQILAALDLEVAARLMRRLDAAAQEALLGRMDARRARNLRSLLGFPPNTAGALMDPDVLALAQDLSAREALVQVREAAEQARYNLYVVDRSQKLVGVLNLRELLLARGRAPLTDLMVRDPQRIRASADRMSVVAHPGWREVHALPVVDDLDLYLGAIRYRTLRELEAALSPDRSADIETSAALGQLFAAGAGGLLDALAVGGSDGR